MWQWLQELISRIRFILLDNKMTKEYGDGNIKDIKDYLSKTPQVHWTGMVIHHSKSKDGVTHDWEAIRKYHVEELGWLEIGYNFGIELVGKQYIYRIGRPLTMAGAHTKEGSQNQLSLGICVIGDYDVAEPLQCQYWLTAKLCRLLMDTYKIPITNIYAHRDWATYKSCPGLKYRMQKLVDYIVGG